MNKIVSTKRTSAVFLTIVLVAGVIGISSPFTAFAQELEYDNNYPPIDSGYESEYLPEYPDNNNYYNSYESTPDYGMDNNYKKSYGKDSYKSQKDSTITKKLYCSNPSVNIKGDNEGDISVGQVPYSAPAEYETEEYLGVSSYSGGNDGERYNCYDEGFYKTDKDFVCIINKNINVDDDILQPFFTKELDNEGIPSVYYGEVVNGEPIGFQRNPVTIALQANEFYDKYKENNDESSITFFLNNANWLVDNAVNKGHYSLLQYDFPLPIYNLEPPWFSAMANGLALQVLIKAHEITLDSKYLIAAKSLLNAFFIEVKDGGITYKDSPDEWWYEEYASNDKNIKISRVLNGMLFTVLGIYDYFKYTGEPDAKLLFYKGVNSIKKELHKYNDNGYSYYDLLGNPANNYHQIHIGLTKQIYDLTGETILNEYHELWRSHRS